MVSGTLYLPQNLLEIIKTTLDVLSAATFLFIVIIIIRMHFKHPFFQRKDIYLPMLLFGVLGLVSCTMDAIDEFIWFSPKFFYDLFWKPTRIGLFIVALFMLILGFWNFYKFSKRLLGE